MSFKKFKILVVRLLHKNLASWISPEVGTYVNEFSDLATLWFQLISPPQAIEQVKVQLKDTPTKVYAKGAKLFLSKVSLEVLQNWVSIQLIVMPHILGKVQGQIIRKVCRLIEPCLLIGTREYSI